MSNTDTTLSEFRLGAFLAARLPLIVILLVCYGAFLVAGLLTGNWLIGANGHPAATDFMGVWAAGRLALEGASAAVFDWSAIKEIQAAATGGPIDGYFSWQYPPSFLCVAAVLALLPYTVAFLAWMGITGALYLATMRRILGEAALVVAAVAFPAVLWNLSVGQTGMLTAALFGGGLAFLRSRPVVAGVLFGLMTYKPQFGILVPIALLCGGHWRVVLSAALTAVVMIGVSAAIFGVGTWAAFLHSLPAASQTMLVDGRVGLIKLQSVFGVARVLGGSPTLAWAIQGAVAAGLAIAIGWLWRRGVGIDLKAAALTIAALLATPYVFIYDLVLLTVPMAFLVRAGLTRRESLGLVAAFVLVLAYPLLPVESGLAAVIAVAAVVASRVVRQLAAARPGEALA
jgi:hypothetical protein